MLTKSARALQRPLLLLLVGIFCASFSSTVAASPFGQGVFGADVPFGSATSLSIALGGNVSLNLTPSGGTFSGSGSHTITVTSTDVVGYKLYAYSPGSTTMTYAGETIPASGNTTAGSLAVNTWGYNTDGSTNYLGMTTSPSLIKDTTGPSKSGDNTTVKYAVLTDITKGAGSYTVSVVYTAVAEND
ncbi:MAG: hypothetical protein ABIR37_01175 [Candidatus Saccharimonadales bacterium]